MANDLGETTWGGTTGSSQGGLGLKGSVQCWKLPGARARIAGERYQGKIQEFNTEENMILIFREKKITAKLKLSDEKKSSGVEKTREFILVTTFKHSRRDLKIEPQVKGKGKSMRHWRVGGSVGVAQY